jgi:hypothetical protein
MSAARRRFDLPYTPSDWKGNRQESREREKYAAAFLDASAPLAFFAVQFFRRS